MRKTVAAVIPVKNVEKIIRGTLESLKFCDEVILVDMFSTDKTKEIALSYPNVKFFERNSYIFANFNYGMDQAQSEYILRLDSDERLSVELQKEIKAILESNEVKDIYTAPYYSYFLGKAMMHGGKFSVRDLLFKKGSLRYMEKSEHEHLQRQPGFEKSVVGELKGAYLHFSCPSIKKYIEKINYYSEKDFERAATKDLKVIANWRVIVHCMRYFYHQYVTMKGYKDGKHGFVMACLDSSYMLINHLKLWEKVEDLKRLHDEEREKCDENLRINSIKA